MREEMKVSFNQSFLRESAKNLANAQSASITKIKSSPVRVKLTKAKDILNEAYSILALTAKKDRDISPAAEWLIDNYYIIQEQIVQIEQDFPIEYQRNIPLLDNGEHQTLPRVFELVLNMFTHTDNLIDIETLTNYVKSYQEEEPLMIGEIWAIPIMLRFVLILSLSERSERVLQRKHIKTDIKNLINTFSERDMREPGLINHELSNWLNKRKNVKDQLLLTELTNQLQNAGLLQDEQKRWLQYKFNQFDMTIEEALRIDAQKQSKLQVSIQNAVISLREISETDWSDFAEDCSIIEQILRLDPFGYYSDMDFQTRDSYRRGIEKLSRYSNYSEVEVAEKILQLCEEYKPSNNIDTSNILTDRSILKKHVGYYLKEEGQVEIENEIGYSKSISDRFIRMLKNNERYYLLGVWIVTIFFLAILWVVTDAIGEPPVISTIVLIIALFPALDLSVSSINRFFAFLLPPGILPKMNYENGIPDESRTLVVVPTLFSSPEDVRRQFEALEIRSLANSDPTLQFAILSDFTDAKQKEIEGDQQILDEAERTLSDFNRKYSSKFGDKFYLLHRERLWNESEECWMGWERKRGKLEEFNKLISDSSSVTSYTTILGDFIESASIKPIRFVITLDSDTRLSPDSAVDLVRTIAHPLNRAWYNPDKKLITKGYSIIQPRISIPPDSVRKTWFSFIFSGNVGLDPYSTAVSDIYQDLTGEAVFTGKGIYDVQAFHMVMENRFPENRILSHDLIESTYLRTGLVTDVELFDDYPSTYHSYSKRNHRWIRGDWQIAAWLFTKVPTANGSVHNPINSLSKWKIFDNLRRSANPLFLTLFFITGWFWLPGSALIWTTAALGILAFPIYISLSTDIVNRPARVKWFLYFDKIKSNLRINTVQAISTIIFLPHQAVINIDAIIRTLWRIKVSQKGLLEWTTASQTENQSPNSFASYVRLMLIPIFLGLACIFLYLVLDIQHSWIALPFAFLWAASPIYAWFLSRPMSISKKLFTDDDELKLRTYARRTWFYFERFVNENHSWLPPDNFQEDPHLEPVARTSPTNIGLALVANQTAYNMGYITFGELLDRSERTLKSLELLERYRGHFYNWYDTKVGGILQPKYISTVDSGNLAAGLITIKEAINKEIKKNIINKNLWRGLKDTVSTLELIFQENELQEILSADMIERINYFLNKIKKNLDLTCPIQSVECLKLLKIIKEDARDLSAIDLMKFRNELGDNRLADLLFWLETPLKLTEKAITEYRLMIDLNSMIGDQSLISLFDKSELNSEFSSDILNKWSRQVREIIEICEKLVSEMDFTFLYIKKRGLFHIGFDVDKLQPDLGTYDLLASEARIASYIAIAKGDIPSEHWFRLSRRLTSLEKNEILLSWGGTMFEYLMPLLFMHSYPNTLLSHTYDSVVKWHQIYGARRGHPWGASESAYYYLNIDMHYQYRAFGVPGLGLKRGLAEEYVIAPYASILSLMVDPGSAIKNLKKIENIGGLGLLGFYDAIDFTPSRLKESESFKVVKTYMAHHHGMSLVALDNILNGWPVHDYFYSDPQIKGCDLLLQERVPRGVPIKEPHPLEIELEPGEQEKVDYVVEHNGMNEIDAVPPRTQLLSNGSYSVFVSHTGTGCSRYKDEALTAWVPDTTTDPLGLFFYIKDLESGKFWSATHQPVKRKPDRYDTWFHNGKIVTSRVDEWIETTTEVSVSPDHPIELRKLNITNYSNVSRTLEITSYAEVVLNRLDDHNSHPAFSKLFVQTDYLPQFHSLIAKRRPRSEGENEKWLIHSFAGYNSDNIDETLQFETERSKFIGRGRSLSNPEVICNKQKLSGSLGNVSDPIMSLRKKITIKPGEKIQMVFGLGWADSLIETERLADMYDNPNAAYRAFDLGEVYSAVELGHLGITSKQAHYFQKLASYLIYPNSKYRADISVLKKNRKKQKSLWAYGISGDLPLLVFKMDKIEQLKKVETLLKAHAFWRLKGLEVELLILNDHPPSYADEVQESIIQAVESSLEAQRFNVKGGVFLLRSERIPEEDMILILTVANTVFNGSLPKFNDQMEGTETKSWDSGIFDQDYIPVNPYSGQEYTNAKAAGNENDLIMFNGFGGFTKDGGEYHIIIHPDSKNGLPELPPAPWVNIISNRNVGFIATEKGAGYTWSENSRENKLTQWSNDPVRDPHSEALYLRDEISGEFWSPTPGPTPGAGSYRVVHGFGYTKYSHDSQNLKQELLQFVPEDDPVKISKLKIKNSGDKKRYISIFSYNDLVLGVKREASVRYILNELSEDSQTIFSQNHYNNEFSGRVVFNSLIPSGKVIEYSYTNNRENFIGRNRSLENPKAIGFTDALDNEIIGSGDLCTAFQAKIELMPGEEKEIIFLIGETDDKLSANKLIQLYSSVVEVEQEFERVKKSWKKRLSRIEVETPEPSLDIIVNGWLMYQNISSRMWSRTAFYQAGGAYGFRDQLQDAMAVTYVDPSMARNQILLHAEKQFREGDVLHWWHPPTGRGIRSRISDDRLWLPYVTNFYLSATGDLSILEENVSYIKARELEPGEQEAYLEPTIDAKKGSIYEHCCKAIDISLKFGRHGLPLMGAGDWNDGMNRVGENGEGESVWLGFFIYSILTSFQEICRNRGDFDRADRYNSIAGNLKKQLNDEGWDGNWYLRAYYDDGSPLGSSINDECRIDGISQAWSVISGVATKERGLQVLKEIEKNLISEKDGIIRLLTPPFDKTEKNPGYIKGYIPGVRENGGQYTHAALWTVKAFAKAGLGDKAVQYFNMINPINHALTLDDVSVYKAEPYVVAADVYGESPLTGQAGWTWYTGSAGWMYRVAIESILGFTLQDDKIIINPSISHSWTGFKIRYKPDLEGTIYIISVENPDKLESGRLEGNVDNKTIEFDSNEAAIKIILDGKEHSVNLTIRRREKD